MGAWDSQAACKVGREPTVRERLGSGSRGEEDLQGFAGKGGD